MLKILNVRKTYGHHLVIDLPSLGIKSGLYWLKGANGSGKSTFLKIVSGLIPFEGDIEIDAVPLRNQPTAYRKLVSYAAAEPVYPDYVSGYDLVQFYNSVRKADTKLTDQLIDRLGVREFYKNPTGTYSSGMEKKLSLALAFIGQSKFIFLDEPLVTLDRQAVPLLLALITDYKNQGVSFIFTSHQHAETDLLNPVELIMKDKTVCIP
jgi:ABC-2 type transport system ATP-binding protein